MEKFKYFSLVSIPLLGIINHSVGATKKDPQEAAEEAASKVLWEIFKKNNRRMVEHYGRGRKKIGYNPARIFSCNALVFLKEVDTKESFLFEVNEIGVEEI